MPQISDVTANENARYKRNELEYKFNSLVSTVFKRLYPYLPIVTYLLTLKIYRLHPLIISVCVSSLLMRNLNFCHSSLYLELAIYT